MNTNRLLNILILALAFFLALQLLSPKATETEQPKNGIYLSVQEKTVTMPNIPQLMVANYSSGALSIETCEDIKFSVNSQKIEKISEVYPDFCSSVVIAEQSEYSIDLMPLHSLFADEKFAGQYIVSLHANDEDYNAVFEVKTPGFFRSTLSAIIYEPIYNLFVAILTFLPGHPLGWAIIIITIIVRLILLVPQHQMLKNTKKMQEINPKITAIREKYKGNQAEMGQAMMALYKKEGVNPAGSCLPLLIQMPVLIGLYWVISGITDPSNFYHLYSFFKDFDPTSINTNFFGINLMSIGGVLGVIAGVILAATQWVQAYLSFSYNAPAQKPKKQEKKSNDEAPQLNPEMMQKMMLYFFPLMLGVTAIFFPLGVGLYWFIGTLFIIGQQFYVTKISTKNKQQGEIVKK